MTDYKEEQRNEIEALQCIYPEEFSLLSSDSFLIRVTSESSSQEDEENECVCAELQFEYTPTYPDEAPKFQVVSCSLEEEHQQALLQLLQEQAEENLGMVMVFTLVSAVQEYLNESLDNIKLARENAKLAEEERQRKEEEKVFIGTPVTIETFLKWKSKFDEECESQRSKQKTASDAQSKKSTGKELFEHGNARDDSELSLLDEGDRVEVDESLFEDIDDLDLEDDDLDIDA
ncbi:RWD domain-containing protein 1-like [Anneissia japonica]|uniref:RWD domain-containing protein 1-like n=1 Tax=Anneissia japonica TaxID=1529436 RepID=UPI00142566A8|nr:RWD domain-containing protein 1-like [Anneissia japonica]